MSDSKVGIHANTRLKREDEVIVISGKEKGKRGKIMFIDKNKGRVLVQGVNKIKRHQRPTQENPQGGEIEIEASVHISNVMVYDSKQKKGARMGIQIAEDGKKKRVLRTKTGLREV